ncbi:MAG: hypothetical protein Q8O32_02050, partial [bacterium]|nr:hypothetical protein [bacterium]
MSFFYKIRNQKVLSNFLIIFLLAELLSFLAYNFSFLSSWFLGLIFLLTIGFGFWQEKYLLYLPLAELFWGSLGHSLAYNFISLRLAIFIAVVFVFAIKYLLKIKSLKIFRDRLLSYLWIFILLLW